MPTDGPDLTRVAGVGRIPYRLALAGGWVDQPFVSRLNPRPPGCVVTVGVEPTVRFMDRAGLATGTRRAADALWGGAIPTLDPTDPSPSEPGGPMRLVRDLYAAENAGRADPSGSQDMVGLVYPGVCRLDYDAAHEGGVFPARVEQCLDPAVLTWLEAAVRVVPVGPRPPGYDPLVQKRLDPETVARLGETGRRCFDAIVSRDLAGLGASMNDCVACWASLLPATVAHPTIDADLVGLLRAYQDAYPGAMFSGCGGGYLYVAADRPVPGSFGVTLRRGWA